MKMGFGQINLIENPSFEARWNCPNDILPLDTLFTVQHWTSPLYFNDPLYPSISDSCRTGVWSPGGWYRLPAYYIPRTGRVATTFTTYGYLLTNAATQPIDTRYYTMSRLREPLKAGKTYYFSMFLRSLPSPLDGNWGVYATNGQAAVFSKLPLRYAGQTPGVTFRTGAVEVKGKLIESKKGILKDTVWTKISGCFVAEGDENFVTIGSFLPISSTRFEIVKLARNGSSEYHGRYALDDVSLLELNIKLPNDTTLCAGDTLNLDVRQPISATYEWENGDTMPTRRITKTTNVKIKINIDPTEQGCSIEKTLKVNFLTKNNTPRFVDTLTCDHQRVHLKAGYGLPNEKIVWQDSSRLSVFDTRSAGNFWAKITNACGVFIDSFSVRNENCMFDWFVPNAFSPNGDLQNDVFKPFLNPKSDAVVEKYHFTIFNRWGGIVFESQQIEQGWDGTWNGKSIETGVYVWQLSVTARLANTTIERILSGDVNLLK
jgi:gliding motility-associated-like protein